jgi:hypothetical protein
MTVTICPTKVNASPRGSSPAPLPAHDPSQLTPGRLWMGEEICRGGPMGKAWEVALRLPALLPRQLLTAVVSLFPTVREG